MKLALNDEQQEFQAKVRSFAEEVIKPFADEIDDTSKIPDEIFKQLADNGYLGPLIPSEFGGLGLDGVSYTILIEEISKVCAATGFTLAVHTTTATMPIINFGNEEQKKKYLPKLCSGLAAFSLTEPGAGSDPGSATTTAKLEGDFWIINGKKRFTTNGGLADVIVLLANTEAEDGSSGASAFIVEKDTPGLEIGGREDLMGIRGSEVVELILNDLKVPKENLLSILANDKSYYWKNGDHKCKIFTEDDLENYLDRVINI